jgi:hypothetical protein
MSSYLVRLWEPAGPGQREGPSLCGVVRHVPSGEETTFATETELVTVLRAGVTGAGRAGQDAGPAGDGGK